jgi:MFS family permease
MVPITVSFFHKQAEKEHHRPISMALIYCAGIVGTFTILGLVMSALFGGAVLNQFANNPWLNLFLALLLVSALIPAAQASERVVIQLTRPTFNLLASDLSQVKKVEKAIREAAKRNDLASAKVCISHWRKHIYTPALYIILDSLAGSSSISSSEIPVI